MEKRVYFKNLGGLRFFAATAVIFHHVEQYKQWANLPNIWGNASIDALGHKAVSLFFVLSGFLITYLLLAEHQKTSQISIKDFYVRRILRIWPVYYLVVILCLFVIPQIFDLSKLGVNIYESHFGWKLLLLLLVLPNVVRLFAPNIVGGNQLWSIGVEEQFYLIWPILVRAFIHKLFHFLIAFIAIKFLVTIVLRVWISFNDWSVLKVIHHFWLLLQIEQMAIGAMGAWFLFHRKEKILQFFYNKIVWLISLACVALLFIVPLHAWYISYAEAVVFLIVILNLSTNPGIKFSMENKFLTRMGNVSYGIYMYHTLCITVCLFVLQQCGLDQYNFTLFNIALYFLSIVLTMLVAYFSYEYFEKVFLSLKEKFMIVKSGKK